MLASSESHAQTTIIAWATDKRLVATDIGFSIVWMQLVDSPGHIAQGALVKCQGIKNQA